MYVIPAWTAKGLLPVGIHAASWPEIQTHFGWNARRRSLLLGLEDAGVALRKVGCTRLWLDGSFVTEKELPSDYDGCWDPQDMRLNDLDPILKDYTPAGRVAMKSRYLGDLLIAGVEGATGLPFVDFFQQTRDGQPKGIVLLNPQEIP